MRWGRSAWGAPPGAGRGRETRPRSATRLCFLCLSQPGGSSGCWAQSAAAFGPLCDARRVKVSVVKGDSQKAAGEQFVQGAAQPMAREPSEARFGTAQSLTPFSPPLFFPSFVLLGFCFPTPCSTRDWGCDLKGLFSFYFLTVAQHSLLCYSYTDSLVPHL